MIHYCINYQTTSNSFFFLEHAGELHCIKRGKKSNYKSQRTYIIGSSIPHEHSPLDQHIELFTEALSVLNLGRGSGNLGPPTNAKPLFGWLFVTDAGPLIACRKEDSLIPSAAHCVTKRRRQSNSCSLLVCLHANSGSMFSNH